MKILQPFNFGQVGQITFAQGSRCSKWCNKQLEQSIQRGSLDRSMAKLLLLGYLCLLGAIIKRHKRTLINFQQSFLLPFVKKAAYRYMQFDPENYPVADYKFNATSTLGIIAREYEVTQLVQLLQTMESR